MIQAYLDRYTGGMVCSKQLFKEALNHPLTSRSNGKSGKSTTS